MPSSAARLSWLLKNIVVFVSFNSNFSPLTHSFSGYAAAVVVHFFVVCKTMRGIFVTLILFYFLKIRCVCASKISDDALSCSPPATFFHAQQICCRRRQLAAKEKWILRLAFAAWTFTYKSFNVLKQFFTKLYRARGEWAQISMGFDCTRLLAGKFPNWNSIFDTSKSRLLRSIQSKSRFTYIIHQHRSCLLILHTTRQAAH